MLFPAKGNDAMTRTTLYTVAHQDAGGLLQGSRFFSTVRAARKWAAWLASTNFASTVSVYRGQMGGELVERIEPRAA